MIIPIHSHRYVQGIIQPIHRIEKKKRFHFISVCLVKREREVWNLFKK